MQGTAFKAIYLETALRFEKGESTIKTSVLELRRALTAPMLLPHTTTLNCLLLKKDTATSTSSASLLPREIYSCSILLPQPAKSKQARPTLLGRRASCEYP